MNLLQKGGEIALFVVALRTHWPFRERTAKCGGDPGLVGQILNLDNSTFHGNLAGGVLFDFN